MDTRMLTLIDKGLAAGSPELAEAIARSVYDRSRERVTVALPFIPALLSFLDMDVSTIGAPSYYTLMIVAADAPDHLGPFVGTLIGKLAGPGLAASTFAARIITVLARNRPEYVADARDALRHLCETCPEGILKTEATKAYQAIGGDIGPDSDSGDCKTDEEAITHPPETTADRGAMTIACPPPADVRSSTPIDERLISVITRLFRIRDETRARAAGDEKLDEMAVDASELAQWIEAEFSLTGQPLTPKAAAVTPEEIKALSQCKAPANISQQTTAPGPAAVPALPAASESQLKNTEATAEVSDGQSDCSIDSVEIAAMRDLMAEFESNFSVMAGSLLEDIGMGHLRSRGVGEDRKISAKEFVSAFDKLINEQKSDMSVPLSDAPASVFDAKSLVSELKRCISLSQSTPALVPAPDMPANPVPPAEEKNIPEIVPVPAQSQSPKARRYYTRSGTKMHVKIEFEDDKNNADIDRSA